MRRVDTILIRKQATFAQHERDEKDVICIADGKDMLLSGAGELKTTLDLRPNTIVEETFTGRQGDIKHNNT